MKFLDKVDSFFGEAWASFESFMDRVLEESDAQRMTRVLTERIGKLHTPLVVDSDGEVRERPAGLNFFKDLDAKTSVVKPVAVRMAP